MAVLETLDFQISQPRAQVGTIANAVRFLTFISRGAHLHNFEGPFGRYQHVRCLPSIEDINYVEEN